MRTLFEDTDLKANLEEEKKGGSKNLPLILWLVALLFVSGTWGVYRWVITRPSPEPPPPPVSLSDAKQTVEAFSKFNRNVQDGNWPEAEKLLSTAARIKLAAEKKTLRESMLGDKKDEKVMEAASTPSGDRTVDKVRQDCVYKFLDGQYKILPIGLIIENGQLVIDSWWEDKPVPPEKK
jgi:hypothetical protein